MRALAARIGASRVRFTGRISVLSFHATKVFNTFEGGAIVCPDARTKQRIDYLKNFGFDSETSVVATGINGKMNEFQAALGMLQLNYVDDAIAARAVIDANYRQMLADVPGIVCPQPPPIRWNHAYFPILVEPGFPLDRDGLYDLLKTRGIYSRRYFYPRIHPSP